MPGNQEISPITEQESKDVESVKKRAIIHGAIGGFGFNIAVFFLCSIFYIMRQPDQQEKKIDLGTYFTIVAAIELFWMWWASRDPESFFDYIPKERVRAYHHITAKKIFLESNPSAKQKEIYCAIMDAHAEKLSALQAQVATANNDETRDKDLEALEEKMLVFNMLLKTKPTETHMIALQLLLEDEITTSDELRQIGHRIQRLTLGQLQNFELLMNPKSTGSENAPLAITAEKIKILFLGAQYKKKAQASSRDRDETVANEDEDNEHAQLVVPHDQGKNNPRFPFAKEGGRTNEVGTTPSNLLSPAQQ